MRIPGLVLLVVVLAGCGAAPAPVSRQEAPVRPAAAVEALGVLRDWDRARSRAWARGDAAALGSLYAAGSAAGAHDVAMLRRWTARGLRVRGMTMQLLGVRLEARSARRIVLVVTDRLAAAYATGHGRRHRLPRDDASTRRLELRRVEGRWVMVSVAQTSN